jgi:zinc transport system substrate-binding protein
MPKLFTNYADFRADGKEMRSRLFLTLACLLLAASAGAADNHLRVIATLFPQYDFVRQVGDGRVSLRLLLPPGVEPHSYEPTPQDVLDINRADIFIYTNKYMEPWVEKMLKGSTNKNLLIVDASQGIKFFRARGGVDPHVWLDLDNARLMINNVRDALIARDPSGAGTYRLQAEKYCRQLLLLDEQYKKTIRTSRLKRYIFGGHSAFGYFNRRYGLTDLAAYKGFSPETEPTAKDLIEIIKTSKDDGIKYIFYEELLSPKAAQMIARETGAKLLLLHGAHNLSRRELSSGVTFLSIMEHNLDNLKIGLEWQAK